MGVVNLTVNGRRYEVSCDDGQEDRLRELGMAFDRRVRGLAASLGQVGEARLLLLTGLLLEDEIGEARAGSASSTAPPAAEAPPAAAPTAVDAAAADLERIAQRIEAVAGRLKPT